MTHTKRLEDFWSVRTSDRNSLIREYRNVMHLHGDPAQSENESEDEMIRAITDRRDFATSTSKVDDSANNAL